jgi:hypothetical protein
MLVADETALDVHRRFVKGHSFPAPSLNRRVPTEHADMLDLGTVVEVQAQVGEMTGAVLELILDFVTQIQENTVVVHVSTGANLATSMQHGGVLVGAYPALDAVHRAGKFKEAVVCSLTELRSLLRMLAETLRDERVLVVAEGLGPLFLALRPLDTTTPLLAPPRRQSLPQPPTTTGSSSSSSSSTRAPTSSELVLETLDALRHLVTTRNVLVAWFSTALGKHGGGMREGGPPGAGPWVQQLAQVWKERCPRVMHVGGD